MTTPPDPTCMICSAPIPQRYGEWPGHWRRRKTCSDECKRKACATYANRKLPEPECKTCVVCGKVFRKLKGERADRWRGRQTCSSPCWHKLRRDRTVAAIGLRPENQPKACVQCGKEMRRKRDESAPRWRNRKTCSNECKILHQRSALAPVGPVPVVARQQPKAVLQCCTGCGETIPKPDGMTWAKYRGRSTCGSEECKTATSRKAVSAPKEREMSPLRALLHITRPTFDQLRAYREATPDERRLFSPHIRDIAEAEMGRAA